MSFTRLDDWESRLDAEIDQWRAKVFAWGQTDCACLTAAAVRALTGEDIRVLFQTHPTEEQTTAYVDANGGLEALADRVLGPSDSPRAANKGDIVMVGVADYQWLAVVIGQQALGMGPAGMIPARATHWRRCWRIG